MSLVDEKRRIQEELAGVEAKLEFCAAVLPEDLVSTVQSMVVRGKEVRVSLAGGPGVLSRLLKLFPTRAAQQYLADYSGTAVPREEALSLRTVEAAIPVHPVWLRNSQVLGTAACWVSDLPEGVALTIEVLADGAAEELADLWKGLTPLSNVASYTLRQTTPDLIEGASSTDNPQALLKDAVKYLNGFIQEHQGQCRGYAPAVLLARFATQKLGVRVECSVRSAPLFSSGQPQRSFSVSVMGPKGQYWHELDKVHQEYRLGNPEDSLWYDLVE